MGPVVVGDGSTIGEGAALRETIVLPGTDVAAGTILVGAIVGHAGVVEGLRPYGA
jgi:mannose-1-phosphate guanylyltransferase/mannose-1-phosphate guanylyltransferase/phosphomannomutase